MGRTGLQRGAFSLILAPTGSDSGSVKATWPGGKPVLQGKRAQRRKEAHRMGKSLRTQVKGQNEVTRPGETRSQAEKHWELCTPVHTCTPSQIHKHMCTHSVSPICHQTKDQVGDVEVRRFPLKGTREREGVEMERGKFALGGRDGVSRSVLSHKGFRVCRSLSHNPVGEGGRADAEDTGRRHRLDFFPESKEEKHHQVHLGLDHARAQYTASQLRTAVTTASWGCSVHELLPWDPLLATGQIESRFKRELQDFPQAQWTHIY